MIVPDPSPKLGRAILWSFTFSLLLWATILYVLLT